MKALFVHQNFPAQYKHLAPALAERGVDVVAMGEADNLARVAPFHPKVRLMGYPKPAGAHAATHHYLRGTEAQVRRGQAVVRAALALRDQGFTPDIIMAHPGWGESLFLKDVFPKARISLFLEFFYRGEGSDMGFDPEYPVTYDDRFRVRIRNATQLLSLESADAAVSPTYWQQRQYPEIYLPRIDVVHDGVDTQLVRPRPDAAFELADKGLRLTAQDEVVTYVARNLEPYRGFHTFMRALPELLARRPQAQVVLVGGDEVSYGRNAPEGKSYRSMLMAEVGDKLDMSRVHFVGRLPYGRFLDLLCISSAHVYLTYPFVLSWSMLEAMASGCLVIGSRTPPVEEVIEDRKNGLLVDFFSPKDVVEKVVQALENPEDMKAIRAAARETVVSRYDLRTICLPRQLELVDKLARG